MYSFFRESFPDNITENMCSEITLCHYALFTAFNIICNYLACICLLARYFSPQPKCML